MKVVNDKEQAQPKENAVSRKKLDEWQRKDQTRRIETEQRPFDEKKQPTDP
jgi:hypothetical protein